ncbi:MAG: metal-dependent hydrolase [Pseudomonadota bacterium]
MIIGHLPAGYLAAKTARWAGAPALFWGILIGSVMPDLDMLWFFFVDQGQTHHHTFITHRPIIWVLLALTGLAFSQVLLTGLGIGAILHVGLDSFLGNITWLWPLSDVSAPLVIVPATQSHWILSFIFHWTFLMELVLVACALVVFVRSPRTRM